MKTSAAQFIHSAQFTTRLLEFMQEGLLILNESNNIEIANSEAVKLFGFSKSEMLIGKHFRELHAESNAYENFIVAVEDDGNLKNHESTLVRSNGQHFTGLCSATIVRDVEDTMAKVILIQDVTGRKKSMEKVAEYTKLLERNNKELDQFAYIVSHDLKAPLRAISNLASWLAEDLGTLSDENKDNLEKLQGRVKRLESLINGILEYSKVGRERAPSEMIDIFQLVTEVLEMLSPPPKIKIDITLEMPAVEAPRTMLFQVFSNLISNAIKYNDKKEGLIKISGIDHDDYYEFGVEDNGPGIASEYHEKIFVIFQTLQSRDKFESTGIGLTIVKRIIEDRKGEIRIESELGKGSKFIFTWPKVEKND